MKFVFRESYFLTYFFYVDFIIAKNPPTMQPNTNKVKIITLNI
jgi:hypothetical protein